MRFVLVFAVALALDGCSGSFSIPPQPVAQPIVPPGDKIEIFPGGKEVIEPATPDLAGWCFPPARYFPGTVAKPCADVAEQTR
jgi:hypothetical protein